MATNMKHVGRIKNTGRRCVVVFREMYDEQGEVIDENHCLVFETENLPDAEHQDLMRIIESDTAQTTSELYNVLTRSRLGSGVPALTWLASSQRLRKFPTNNIELTPSSGVVLGLDTLNKIVKMQKSGATEEQVNNAIRDDTDMPPREVANVANAADDSIANIPPAQAEAQPVGENVLDDAAIAMQRLNQAEMFEAQAKDLREQAYEIDPSLKPKRGRKAAPKKSTAKQ